MPRELCGQLTSRGNACSRSKGHPGVHAHRSDGYQERDKARKRAAYTDETSRYYHRQYDAYWTEDAVARIKRSIRRRRVEALARMRDRNARSEGTWPNAKP